MFFMIVACTGLVYSPGVADMLTLSQKYYTDVDFQRRLIVVSISD